MLEVLQQGLSAHRLLLTNRVHETQRALRVLRERGLLPLYSNRKRTLSETRAPYYCRRNPSSLSMRSLETAKRPHGPVIYKDLIALTYTTNRSQEGPFWGEVALPSVESERRVVPPPIQGVIRHRGGPLMPLGRPWRRGVPDERGQHRSPQSPSGA